MEIEFEGEEYRRLETDANFTNNFSGPVVKKYRMRVAQIRAALDRRDLMAIRSVRLKKLKGDRAGQYSLRLNDQWRLIVRFVSRSSSETVRIVEVTDYH